jgi:hypothetical protein
MVPPPGGPKVGLTGWLKGSPGIVQKFFHPYQAHIYLGLL